MNMVFVGAAREVTGSCILLRACGRNILVDCGMEQGRNVFENRPIPVPPAAIDCLLLTHAHIDHSGMIPKLAADGFRGAIYATKATCELCEIMLRDSAHIQETEAEWANRKARRAGAKFVAPIYGMKDAECALSLFSPCFYATEYRPFEGITVRFIDAGHLLGSASILVSIEEEGVKKTVLFSGDIGNVSRPLIKDPTFPEEGDIVVIESTYGDRTHPPRKAYERQFASVLQETFDKGGTVVIPSFAVGRTQELLYLLREIKRKNLVVGHDGFPVWVDSPLAAEATSIYSRGMTEFYDAETLAMIERGEDPIRFPDLRLSRTAQDSAALNFDATPKVIVSASGMCEAGRIRHHLKHNLWRENCAVLFVGYQAAGTLGRAILDGAKSVRLFKEEISVNARICAMDGISGHADKGILLRWIGNIRPAPERAYVVHGEESSAVNFARSLKAELGIEAIAPYPGASYDLVTGARLDPGVTRKIGAGAPRPSGFSAVFQRLREAASRLASVVNEKEGHSNRELERFARQIDSLTDKWSE